MEFSASFPIDLAQWVEPQPGGVLAANGVLPGGRRFDEVFSETAGRAVAADGELLPDTGIGLPVLPVPPLLTLGEPLRLATLGLEVGSQARATGSENSSGADSLRTAVQSLLGGASRAGADRPVPAAIATATTSPAVGSVDVIAVADSYLQRPSESSPEAAVLELAPAEQLQSLEDTEVLVQEALAEAEQGIPADSVEELTPAAHDEAASELTQKTDSEPSVVQRAIRQDQLAAETSGIARERPTQAPAGVEIEVPTVAASTQDGSRLAAAEQQSRPVAAESRTVPQFDLSPEADIDQIAGRIRWLADQQVGEARIRLNPPELGALDIRLSVIDDETFVQISTQGAATRELLEGSIPRLRVLLGAGGLSLGSANIDSGGSGGDPQPETADDFYRNDDTDPAYAAGTGSRSAHRPRGLDLYA